MIEQPPRHYAQSPMHLIDTLVSDGTKFQMWDNRPEFDNKSQGLFQFQKTAQLEESVGCLVLRAGITYHLTATAFVVMHRPFPSNLTLNVNDPQNPHKAPRPIKALLLTAAHVFTSPFAFRENTGDLFFTLSPDVSGATFDTYSRFKVERLLSFNPSEGEEQIDPLTGYPFMIPQDFQLLAIFEGDTSHQLRANGNDFQILKHQSLNPLALPQQCVIVGYPGAFETSPGGSWAPIIGRDANLIDAVMNIGLNSPDHPTRVFSTGQIIGANNTCVAVNCSAWKGMSGSPICIASQNGGEFSYCGVYNGSAALPFQALISKILFRIQGKQPALNVTDIPNVRDLNPPPAQPQVQVQNPLPGVPNPQRPMVQNRLLWAKILQKLLITFLGQDHLHGFLTSIDRHLRTSLVIAEKYGINVEHNLGVCGGTRFDRIMRFIQDASVIQLQGSQPDFTGLVRFGQDHFPALVTNTIKEKFERFWNEGINRKKKSFLKTTDAEELAWKLRKYLKKFTEEVRDPANINDMSENKIKKKFEKRVKKFRNIFQIWLEVLNTLTP